METITVPPSLQVVIPGAILESLGIQPGQKVQVLQYEDRIELIPLKAIEDMQVFLQGIDTLGEFKATNG